MRLTFKAFHDVLQAQGDAIRSLERQLDNKISANDFESTVREHVEACTSEVTEQVSRLSAQVSTKLDRSDVSSALSHYYATRSDVEGAVASSAARLEAILDSKASRDEVASARADAQERLGSLARSTRAEMARKADADDMAKRLETKVRVSLVCWQPQWFPANVSPRHATARMLAGERGGAHGCAVTEAGPLRAGRAPSSQGESSRPRRTIESYAAQV